MFRNQYDSDISTWSPQGRIHQIEYAMESVKQGSAAVGLRSKSHAVLGASMRAPSELGTYQKKVFKIDDHAGLALAGLTSDGRVLLKYMRGEALNHKFVYDSPIQLNRLVLQVADSKLSPARGSTHAALYPSHSHPPAHPMPHPTLPPSLTSAQRLKSAPSATASDLMVLVSL
jgi:hypothetical protein